MNVRTRLVVKGGTGAALLDTSRDGCALVVEPSAGGWTMRIGGVDADRAGLVERLREEIHCFYYEDNESDGTQRKWWLYDKAAPRLRYEPVGRTLTIEAAERVSFTVDSAEHGVWK